MRIPHMTLSPVIRCVGCRRVLDPDPHRAVQIGTPSVPAVPTTSVLHVCDDCARDVERAFQRHDQSVTPIVPSKPGVH